MYPLLHFHIANIAQISISTYSLFACIGLFFFMLMLYVRVKEIDLSFQAYLILVFCMVVGAGIGSKALFFLTKLPDVFSDFSFVNLTKTLITSGFVFYGGLFGALAASKLFSHMFHIPFSQLSIIIAPALPLFHAWGRIGCLFAGCCYGKVATWGVVFQKDPNVLRIPIQLIESCCLLIIFFFLLYLDRKPQYRLSLMKVYLLSYAICRFILEFFRGDEIRGIWFGLSTSQWISLFILAWLIGSFCYNSTAKQDRPH